MIDRRFEDTRAHLERADGALRRGEHDHARACAVAAAQLAAEAGDAQGQAEALLRIARVDTFVSRLRSAHRAAHRAVNLFEQAGDAAGEARSLVIYSYVASCLRRNELAVTSAIMAAALAQTQGDARLLASAHNARAIALIANGDFDRSADALDEAVDHAARCGEAATFPSRLNRCYGEIVRASIERHLYSHPADGTLLEQALQACRRLVQDVHIARLDNDAEPTPGALLAFTECIAAAWRGDIAQADSQAMRVAACAARHARTSWLHAIAMWAQSEVARSRGDLQAAVASMRAMIDVALSVEHEQLARTGRMLASDVLDAQGRSREALAELRALARRDIEIRRESLEHHDRVAQRQLELRHRSQQLRELEVESRRLEQWSLEDPLTALPNRRQLEQCIAAALARAARRGPAIALLDVDRFKEINDRHSHAVGDRVLQSLAALLRAHLRQGDLPARMAGDEFVIVFANADLQSARLACERLRGAVRRFAWHELATGIEVDISVGLAEATPQDTIDTLLARADEDMYRMKSRPTR
ncbi:MAG: diguanylate cyclase [Burkholderiaceae bacterium]|nr:diguanylate cyclase [Burkholderiaceae bacterium]